MIDRRALWFLFALLVGIVAVIGAMFFFSG